METAAQRNANGACPVHLSLGSNLGDRETHLRTALDALAGLEGVIVVKVSHHYETEPLGKGDQPDFLNLAAEIETELTPLELLAAIKEIEVQQGRIPTERWGPRVVDIDIVLWGDTVAESDVLTLPHKAFRNRAFVLAPLAEIAPDVVDPVSGMTIAQLAAQPNVEGRVARLPY